MVYKITKEFARIDISIVSSKMQTSNYKEIIY